MRSEDLSFLVDCLKAAHKFDHFDNASNFVVDLDFNIDGINDNFIRRSLVAKEVDEPASNLRR